MHTCSHMPQQLSTYRVVFLIYVNETVMPPFPWKLPTPYLLWNLICNRVDYAHNCNMDYLKLTILIDFLHHEKNPSFPTALSIKENCTIELLPFKKFPLLSSLPVIKPTSCSLEVQSITYQTEQFQFLPLPWRWRAGYSVRICLAKWHSWEQTQSPARVCGLRQGRRMESHGFAFASLVLIADKWDSVLVVSSVNWAPVGYLRNNESFFLASEESLFLFMLSEIQPPLLGIRLRSRFIIFCTLSTILSSQHCCVYA